MLKKMRVNFGMAMMSLRRNRVRTFLTSLGIAIGVASIVLVLSLTKSVENIVREQMNAAGKGVLIVQPKGNEKENVLQTLTQGRAGGSLKYGDVKVIEKLEKVKAVVPIITLNETLKAEKTVEGASIVATADGLDELQQLKLKMGSFLEVNAEKNVAVVGRELALNLFGTSHAVGKTFSLMRQQFIVVGVLNENENVVNINNIDFNNTMMVRAEYLNIIEPNLRVQQISVKVDEADTEIVKREIEQVLAEAREGERNFIVVRGREAEHGAGPVLKVIAVMLMVIAGVALFVGGIGVMNIMLVVVSERTREIGIRKAVGATGANIMSQFLLEALMLALMGSVMGLALGYMAAGGVGLIVHVAPFVSVEIFAVAILVAMATGMTFGLYPAMVAGRKDPIESLKYYR